MARKPLSHHLNVRLGKATYLDFKRRSEKDGSPSEVVRKMVEAYLEDRLFIKPPVETRQFGES